MGIEPGAEVLVGFGLLLRALRIRVAHPAPAISRSRQSALGLVLVCTLLAFSIPAAAQQFPFHGYGQLDGLGNLTVTCLVQDRAGYLWACTENGMYRYDGREFQRFGESDGLTDTAIHNALVDQAGRLWAGTAHDLYLYDGDRFNPIRPQGRALSVGYGFRIASPAPNRILVIDRESLLELSTRADGHSWDSRTYFEPPQLQSAPALTRLSSLYLDSNGGIWLGCGGQICHVSNHQPKRWSAANGVPDDQWLSWTLDAHGNLWVRGLNHALVLEHGADRFTDQSPPNARITSDILFIPLMADAQGSILTRTAHGIARWRDGQWQELTMDNGLPTAHVSAVLSAREGAMWLGTSGSGLWRWLGYGTIESWTVRTDADRNPVWSVIRGADLSVTMATRSGCLHINALTQKAEPCAIGGMPAGETQVMARDRPGNLWIGMATGALYRVAAGQRRASYVTNIPFMRKLFIDAEHRLWICTSTGLQVIQSDAVQPVRVSLPEGLGEITDITQTRRGELWIATQGGLLRLRNGTWEPVLLPGSAPNSFSSIAAADNDWFWAGGGSHGLLHLHVSGGHVDAVQWQNALDLADLAVYFTQIDIRGWLWVGTDAGVLVFNGHVWRKFDQGDGLIWNDTDQNSVYADADGTLWIGTSGGVSHIINPVGLLQSAPLDLSIARVTFGAGHTSADSARRMTWRPNLSVDVQLQQLDFGDPNKKRLAVRLRGLSDDWFQTRDFSLHFAALAPGRYVFEAFAEDPDHHRTSATVQEAFEILPPWWQTKLFRALAALVLVAAVATLWRWSVVKLEARRLALERQLAEHAALLDRATRDPLTRLWNRQAILEILARDVAEARANGTSLAVAMIDIDHFKRVNDTMGHQMGDRVLHSIAQHIAARVREGDSLGRYGGEELLLVLPETAPRAPFLLIERLRRTIAEIPFDDDGRPFRVTASLGVAWLTAEMGSIEALIGSADEALYLAKGQGRDRVEYAANAS